MYIYIYILIIISGRTLFWGPTLFLRSGWDPGRWDPGRDPGRAGTRAGIRAGGPRPGYVEATPDQFILNEFRAYQPAWCQELSELWTLEQQIYLSLWISQGDNALLGHESDRAV